MFEAAIDRQMNRAMARFQRNPKPQGANARPMTTKEHEVYTNDLYGQHEVHRREIDTWDNKAGDHDPAPRKISTREREVRQVNGQRIVHESSLKGEYDYSRGWWQSDSRKSWKVTEPKPDSYSRRDLSAGRITGNHLYGIEMRRTGDVIRMVEYDVDLNNPKNSVIAELPQAWVRDQPPRLA